jgi:chemotaxis protein MotA
MPAAIIEIIVIIIMVIVVSFLQKDIKVSKFFISSAAFMITAGGTVAASILHFSSKELLNSILFLKEIFLKKQIDPSGMANIVIELSNLFREKGREGLKIIRKDITHPVLITGLDLLSTVDIEEDEFTEVFQISIRSSYDNLKKYERMFGDMAVYAPMFGLLGTLIGLIQLLRELADPKTITPNMAIALVTTLYGIALAAFIFMPISGKIKEKSELELKNSQIIYDGFLMIYKGLGPFAIEQKLKAYL